MTHLTIINGGNQPRDNTASLAAFASELSFSIHAMHTTVYGVALLCQPDKNAAEWNDVLESMARLTQAAERMAQAYGGNNEYKS